MGLLGRGLFYTPRHAGILAPRGQTPAYVTLIVHLSVSCASILQYFTLFMVCSSSHLISYLVCYLLYIYYHFNSLSIFYISAIDIPI